MQKFQRSFAKRITQTEHDDRAMLPIYPNVLELWARYRMLEPRAGSVTAPWQIALRDWWQFMRRRDALVALRRHADGRDPGVAT